MVRTSGSHPGNRGSIPLGGIYFPLLTKEGEVSPLIMRCFCANLDFNGAKINGSYDEPFIFVVIFLFLGCY